MERKAQPTTLNHLIRHHAQSTNQVQQVANRLRKLLPTRLCELKDVQKSEFTTGKSERLALTSPDYLSHIQELIRIKSDAHRHKILYETYAMLFKARQSLTSFSRALAKRQKP